MSLVKPKKFHLRAKVYSWGWYVTLRKLEEIPEEADICKVLDAHNFRATSLAFPGASKGYGENVPGAWRDGYPHFPEKDANMIRALLDRHGYTLHMEPEFGMGFDACFDQRDFFFYSKEQVDLAPPVVPSSTPMTTAPKQEQWELVPLVPSCATNAAGPTQSEPSCVLDDVSSVTSCTTQRSEKCEYFIQEYSMGTMYAKMVVRGERLQEQGQLTQALRLFDKVLMKHPECCEAKFNKEIIEDELRARAPRAQCYVPMTMFWTSSSTTIEVTHLKPGDKVLDFQGQVLHVAGVQVHDEAQRNMVQLKTRTTSITVTGDHRVLIPGPDGSFAEKLAGDLKTGELVFCAEKPVPLEKVAAHWCSTKVVEVRFEPDHPVQAFIAPKWCLLTKGEQDALLTDDGF
mmetsp:Transcript_129260/g.326280  ORF Transcript_129260/g.326280 Transcript_129260/m.326280 type:complete len:401 (+) Transcript_129260:31-1233(+)